MLFVGVSSAWAGQFKRAAYHAAGQRPYQVITGQFTSSGNLDLVFADWLSGQVCVLLGNGDGTFQRQKCFPVPAPVALASGDFNEDGKLDLAVTEFNGTGRGALGLFLGNGDGTFRKGATHELGVQSGFIAVADFNGDGHLDLAVTNGGEGTKGNVMVFFGTGTGRLGKPIVYPLKNTPGAIAAGDLNEDHSPDLAVTNIEGYVAVLLNDGTGHFDKPVIYNAGGGEVVDVKIADLRNDSRNDLVVANGSLGMVVLLNNGNGTFGPPAIYRPCAGKCSAGPEACTVADFNLDGKLDVACSANIDDSYFYYGKGNGTFGTAIAIQDTIDHQGGFSIAAGNFITGSKAPDLAIPIEEYGKVAIMINTQ
jgi:hypothetical protein